MKPYKCLICKLEIDDQGDNFCSKCRKKDWKLRFVAIQKSDSVRGLIGRSRKVQVPIIRDVAGSYWEKRREL